MILWVLIGIFVLFVLFAFLRDAIFRICKIKICSICAAITIAWVVLIVLKVLGYEISSILLGILLGQSIASLMYLFENSAKKREKKHLVWFKIVIVLLGMAIVYLLLTNGFDALSIVLLAIAGILAIIIVTALRKEKKHTITKKGNKFKNELNKLEKKLEDCCD